MGAATLIELLENTIATISTRSTNISIENNIIAIVAKANARVVNTNARVVKHIIIERYIITITKFISVTIQRAQSNIQEQWHRAMMRSEKPNWSLDDILTYEVL